MCLPWVGAILHADSPRRPVRFPIQLSLSSSQSFIHSFIYCSIFALHLCALCACSLCFILFAPLGTDARWRFVLDRSAAAIASCQPKPAFQFASLFRASRSIIVWCTRREVLTLSLARTGQMNVYKSRPEHCFDWSVYITAQGISRSSLLRAISSVRLLCKCLQYQNGVFGTFVGAVLWHLTFVYFYTCTHSLSIGHLSGFLSPKMSFLCSPWLDSPEFVNPFLVALLFLKCKQLVRIVRSHCSTQQRWLHSRPIDFSWLHS